jgi:protocatechuate 3,4-dioxygenase beta subunit
MSPKFIWRSLAHPLSCFCLTLFALLFALNAGAQEVRGVVTGRITDPTGAIVPQAEVDVTAVDTGVVTKVKTNADGQYEVPFLLPGVYTVTALEAGFGPT